MAQSNEFPAFISMEYRDDAGGFPAFEAAGRQAGTRAARFMSLAGEEMARATATGARGAATGFASFTASAGSAADGAKREFEAAFASISALAKKSIVAPSVTVAATNGTGLDLGVEEYQQAAQAARQHAIATRQIADAHAQLSASANDVSAATRREGQAFGAAAIEADRLATEAEQQAATMQRLQAQLDLTGVGTRRFRDEQGRVAVSAGQQRQSMLSLGQQFQDFAVQVASGQSAVTAFVQQAPQAGYALSGFQGKLGAVGAFLTGPWGVALSIAGIAVATLGSRLFDAGDAADQFKKRQEEMASFLDRTTGKIREQITYLGLLEGSRNLKKDNAKQTGTYNSARGQFTGALVQAVRPTVKGERGFEMALPSTVSASGQKLLNQLIVDYERGAINAAAAVQKLNAAAASDTSLKSAAASVERYGFAVNVASGAVNKTRFEQARLAVAMGTATDAQRKVFEANKEATGSSRARIDAETDLVTATNRREKAQASLRIVQLDGEAATKAGGKAEAEYRSRLIAAKTELNAAEAAERAATQGRRDHTKAVNEHNKAVRAAIRLTEQQAQAERSIAGISGQFDAAPRLIDQMDKASVDLDAIIAKYGKLKDAASQKIVVDAEVAKKTVADAPARNFNDIVRQQRDDLAVQQLVLEGRNAEADALRTQQQLMQQLGVASADQLQARLAAAGVEGDIAARMLAGARAQEAIGIAIENQRRIISLYVSSVGDAQRTFESFLTTLGTKPGKAFSNLGKDLLADFNALRARLTSEKLFGGLDREIEQFVNGQTGVKAANAFLEASATDAGKAAMTFADAVTGAADLVNRTVAGIGAGQIGAPSSPMSIAGITSIAPSSSDLAGDIAAALSELRGETGGEGERILVEGRRPIAANDNAMARAVLTAAQTTNAIYERVAKRGTDELNRIFGTKFFSQFNSSISGAIAGYAQAGPVGGVLGALKGIKGLPEKLDGLLGKSGVLGDAISGAQTGQFASGIAKALGVRQSATGAAIGGAIGSALPIPGGAIIGGLVGGTLGGALKKTKTASSTIGVDSLGRFNTTSTGNNAKFEAASNDAAGSVIANIQKIADQLGGSVNAAAGSVSIGVRHGDYRVDTTGRGVTKKAKGAIDFDDDLAGAVQAATVDLIRDGVITGLRASTQRLISASADLDAAIAKAATFESVFTRLKQFTDPIGASIDTLDKQFTSLRQVFKEAGASAEEYAQLEQLYGLERTKAIKDAGAATVSALKGLLTDLTTNNDSLSLRDRLTTAMADYQPLAADVAAGKTVDYDAFATAARTVLDIQRALYGSQSEYFDSLNQVTDLTKKALAGQENIISIATGKTTPFDAGSGTNSAGVTVDNAPVVSAVGSVEAAIANGFAATNSNLAKLIAAGGNGIVTGVAQSALRERLNF